MELALKNFLLFFFFQFRNCWSSPLQLLSQKRTAQFYKKSFRHCYGQCYISHEQYLPSVSALLVIIKNIGFPKYRTLYLRSEEAYLLLLIVLMASNLTASAPKRELKIKVLLCDSSRGKELPSETCLPAASAVKCTEMPSQTVPW